MNRVGELLMSHGLDLIQGLLVVFLGLLLVRWLLRVLRHGLARIISSDKWVATVTNTVGVILVLVVIVAASVEAGLPIRPVLRLLIVISLVAVGLIVLFRPMVPELPFKVGNTVKVGNMLGKVEATTFLSTRLRTFDGKTVFVPNRQILNDVVVNYHYTKTRRIKINLGIRYDSDLIRAKDILERLMTADPRVTETPRPLVYVLALTADRVELGARCWVPNMKYLATRSDLMEKIKHTFDREGIQIARTQMDIYHHDERQSDSTDDLDTEHWS
jgi:small conductance mechanosensitive channel